MTTDHEEDFGEVLAKKLRAPSPSLIDALRAAGITPATTNDTTNTSTSNTSLTHQDHALAQRLGALVDNS